MQKHVYIVIHAVVSGVLSCARKIIGLDSYMNKFSLLTKFSLKIGMGMDNPVTGLAIK